MKKNNNWANKIDIQLAEMIQSASEEYTDQNSFTHAELMQSDPMQRTRMQWRTIIDNKLRSGEWIKTKKRCAKCGIKTSYKKNEQANQKAKANNR